MVVKFLSKLVSNWDTIIKIYGKQLSTYRNYLELLINIFFLFNENNFFKNTRELSS